MMRFFGFFRSSSRAQLKKRLASAITFLKQTPIKANDKKMLGELPHYLVLGPGGAGKTNLLLHSGLQFLLSKKYENSSPFEIPSTEDANFWATKEAVFIDVGRDYTVHNHLGKKIKERWMILLKVLKKSHHSIAGVIVVTHLCDLEELARNKKARHSSNIRDRLDEINTLFKIDVPVYLCLSQCDQIEGFQEFFMHYSKTERQQVWGVTRPLSKKGDSKWLDFFSTALDELGVRLNERVMKHLHAEYRLNIRSKLLPFSWRFLNYKSVILSFIQETFGGGHLQKNLNLRGIYFTSSMQKPKEYTILDHHETALQCHDLKEDTPWKSYFVESMFRRVLFQEALSNVVPPKTHSNFIQRSVFLSCAFALLGATLFWTTHFSKNVALLNQGIYHLGQYEALKSTLQGQDVTAWLPTLHQLTLLNESLAQLSPPRLMRPSHQVNLAGMSTTLLNQTLHEHFLPAVGDQLIQEIETLHQNNSPILSGAVTAYMMLVEPINLKPQFVEKWLNVFWSQHYADKPATLSQLQGYLQDALGNITQGIPVRPAMVGLAEQVLHPPAPPAEKNDLSSNSNSMGTMSIALISPMIQEMQPSFSQSIATPPVETHANSELPQPSEGADSGYPSAQSSVNSEPPMTITPASKSVTKPVTLSKTVQKTSKYSGRVIETPYGSITIVNEQQK